jgi:multimeric flavodoxin WrbA
MDDTDQLTPVYEALVFWADVVLVSTSIRWGAPAALYSKMIERMNCIQNQVTIRDRVLMAAGEGPAQIERGGRKAHPSP